MTLLPQTTRDAYKEWWETCMAADEKFQRFLDDLVSRGDSAEDLGDFVEGMATVRSFGPNPKEWEHADDKGPRTE